MMNLIANCNRVISCGNAPFPQRSEINTLQDHQDQALVRQSLLWQQLQAQWSTQNRSHPLRIALYSHDTMGLGHKRRNVLIAQTLSRALPQSSILLISGMKEGSTVNLPANIDYLALPALHKGTNGKYQPRRLDVSLQDLIAMRSQVIQAAVGTFAPDLFVVDNVPRGAVRELNPALEQLRTHGQTRCVLGLRDILDEPEVVQREWQHALNEDAIRQYYDAVWVYGDPTVFDLVKEYCWAPDIAAKVHYTGYFDQRQRLQYVESSGNILSRLKLPPGSLALCLVGGGQDGADLAKRFAQAILPTSMNGVILTGPFMPTDTRQELHEYVETQPRLRVLEYLAEPTQLLKHADCVVSMGGYNTTCELLSFGKRSLIVPRTTPRLEQWIRAERLRDLGWVDVLHPDQANPDRLTDWLNQSQLPSSRTRSPLDLNGLNRLPELAIDVLTRVHPTVVPSQPAIYHVS